jgi:hypothetical protein
MMATYELRPLGSGEILDRGITLYREHFAILLGVAGVCQGPAAVVNLYVALGGGLFVHPIAAGAAVVLGFFGLLLAGGATLRVISRAYLGSEPALGDALAFAAKRLWPLFVAGLASGLLVGLGMMLLVVPGLIIGCGYSVVSQVVVLEAPERPTDALGRSWALTKGFKGKALGIGFVTYVLVILPGAAVVFFTRSAPEVGQVADQLLSLVLKPILVCVFTLFYYDLRVRKEAFDLEVLGQQIGFAAPTT